MGGDDQTGEEDQMGGYNWMGGFHQMGGDDWMGGFHQMGWFHVSSDGIDGSDGWV